MDLKTGTVLVYPFLWSREHLQAKKMVERIGLLQSFSIWVIALAWFQLQRRCHDQTTLALKFLTRKNSAQVSI